MLNIIRFFFVYGLFCGSVAAASVDDIDFITEQYPPYNFTADGKLQGIAVDTLTLMLQRVGSRLTREDLKPLPWARGYKRVQTEPNTCLFSTTRTDEREPLFKWVGPIAPNTAALIARTENNIEIDSVEDMKLYRIGTIRDDFAESYLVSTGISIGDLERVAENVLNIKKLNRGRIDLWAYGENVAMWELKANGFNPANYESVYELDSKDLYFAFHIDTPDSVVEKLQAALDAIKADGEYEKILSRYLR